MKGIVPWSYSRLKAFDQCPKQFYHMKILKEYEDKETSAMRYGTMFHTAAEKYVRDGTPLPAKFDYALSAIDSLKAKRGDKLCEYKLGLTEDLEVCGFYDKAVWFRGIADLLIIDNDVAWVVDYKTGKSARYADKGQLELMAMAVFKHFPKVEVVRAALMFVVSEDLITSSYNREQEGTLWDKWIKSFNQLKGAYTHDVWNAKPSGLCRNHCAVTECAYNGRN